jgi:tripartite-type tricarboxylate transporter receptor subunit TctC
MHRRITTSGAWRCFAALLALAVCGAQAQDFPNQPVRVISPAPPGGTLDSAIRAVAEKAAPLLKQSIVPDSRPGASGNIAADAVARAAADGHVLLLGNDGIHATNPHIFRTLPFDAINGFVPVIELGAFPVTLLVRSDFPARTLTEFVAYSRKHPGKVSYGTPGVGSTHHLAAELLSSSAAIRMTHIPYKGADAISMDIGGGRLDAALMSLASAEKLVKANQGRILGVASPKRLPSLPAVPAFSESYPGAAVQPWFGLLAPRGTPPARVEVLAAAFATALQDPQVVAKLQAAGVVISGARRDEFAETIRADHERRGTLIRNLGLRND